MEREDLVKLLQGSAMLGGAKPKKRNPWLAFLKKHPNLSFEEASAKYQKQKKGKGVEEKADDEYEYVLEGGKVKRRKKRKTRRRRGRGADVEFDDLIGGADFPSSAYQTEQWKEIDRAKRLGKLIYEGWKKLYPKDFKKYKLAVGAGATSADFEQFAKGKPSVYGIALRREWNAELAKLSYESDREKAFILLAGEITRFMEKNQDVVKDVEVSEI